MMSFFSNEVNNNLYYPSDEERKIYDVIPLAEFDAEVYSENDGVGYWGLDHGFTHLKVGQDMRPVKCDYVWWLAK
jgi:hypothetical protein